MVQTQPVGMRPLVELETTDHPLAIEQREGITMDRVLELAERILHPEELHQTGQPRNGLDNYFEALAARLLLRHVVVPRGSEPADSAFERRRIVAEGQAHVVAETAIG